MKRAMRSTVPTPHAVNLFLSMEAGNNTDAVTTALLNSATVGSGGAWSLNPSPLTALTVSTAFDGAVLPRTVSVAGTSYTGSGGTRGYAYSHLVDDNYAVYSVTSNSQTVSVGFWHQTNL